jgi:NTP pyrophosphatase (non-canonical NTP hydrolase)
MNNNEHNHTTESNFIDAFNAISKAVHLNAVDKGFWDDRRNLETAALEFDDLKGMQYAMQCVDAAALALIHSEVSEALEASRHGNLADDKIPEFSGVEAELADAIIRIMDLAEARGWRIAEAIVRKAQFNSTRPFLHGKTF